MGIEDEARVGVSVLADYLLQMAGRLGSASELGSLLHKTANQLAKAVPPGTIAPGTQQAFMQKLMMANRQNSANVAAMRGMAGGAGAGGGQAGIQPPPTPRPPPSPPMIGAAGGTPAMQAA